jgi:hypothetical protein
LQKLVVLEAARSRSYAKFLIKLFSGLYFTDVASLRGKFISVNSAVIFVFARRWQQRAGFAAVRIGLSKFIWPAMIEGGLPFHERKSHSSEGCMFAITSP